ncbi:hypothetical protein O987_17045 [Comamonas testosteroni TK102]|uniref:Uncharacterized protein n=1 Tax=Comamonas testosteroni TK102 TaxID=1392005 RepID=A0A076PS61_COMTE|nr:hypothetical protein O987_17045 [Comamonas testosteroni TK102]
MLAGHGVSEPYRESKVFGLLLKQLDAAPRDKWQVSFLAGRDPFALIE